MPKPIGQLTAEIHGAAEALIEDYELPGSWDSAVRLSGDTLIRLVDLLDEYNEAYVLPPKPRYAYRTCYECGELIPPDVHGLPPRTRSRWGLDNDAPATFCQWCSHTEPYDRSDV